jgi:hypothetical protein
MASVDQVRGQMMAWNQPMSRIRVRPEWATKIDSRHDSRRSYERTMDRGANTWF